jgi:hypothetical protein
VADALHAIGQTLANLGYTDHRLLPSGKLDFRLSQQISHYNKEAPPPSRVKPIPLAILMQTITLLRLSTHSWSNTIADMLTLGFYFLLRPGEYAQTTNPESTPFRMQDIHLQASGHRLNHLQCRYHMLDSATFVCLELTKQKNGIRGELIGLGRSGNPAFCPVQACINRIKHLRLFHAPPHTPLFAFFTTEWLAISTTILTHEL